MTINKTNIKTLLGISTTTYDNQIDMLIPQLLDSICEYCKNDFILSGLNGYVFDSKSMVITSTTITLSTTIPIAVGDFIRILGSSYNDGMYQVKTYIGGIITIETSKTMRAETVTAIISIVDFPSIFINLIADFIKNTIINSSNTKVEEIDDTRVEYFNNFDSNYFVKSNQPYLNNYKNVYKKTLADLLEEIIE